jgi:acylphosphatase
VNETFCQRVLYSGLVQGVGFRYTAQSLAASFAVAGYVRNLANGNVELVAQGTAAQVEAFLQAVARKMAAYIGNNTVTEEPPGNYREFGIRH